jgi:hypothetical protein
MRSLRFLLVASFALAAFSCGESPQPATVDGKCEASHPPTTLTQAYPVFVAKCIDTCHKPGGTGTGDYSTQAEVAKLVGKKSGYATGTSTLKVVDPSNSANSTVWLKVLGGSTRTGGARGPKGESVGAKMPQAGATPLTDEEKKTLKDWICSGASTQ